LPAFNANTKSSCDQLFLARILENERGIPDPSERALKGSLHHATSGLATGRLVALSTTINAVSKGMPVILRQALS